MLEGKRMKRKVACEKEGFKTFESKRPRQAGRCLPIAMLFLLLVTPSFLFPQPLYDYVNYVRLLGPSSYPLRWGEKEPVTDDMVPLPPGYEDGSPRVYPGCYKIGTSGFSVAYSFKANFDAFVTVTVLDSENKVLYQKVTPFPTPPTGVVTLYSFSLPGYIEELRVIVQWAQWQPAVVIPVFVVLDDPKPPMDPDWVSVLRISCQWARGESTVEGAARKLTEMTHQNTTYDTEALLFCYPPLPDQGEYFYLKLFLNRGMRGQCNEIADFLCCLMTSVGIRASVQRTNRRPFPKEAAFWTNKLLIRELREGELLTYRHHRWHYHQYVLFNCSPQSVYDGTVRFHPTVVHPYYPHQAPDYGYVVGWVRGGVPSDGDWARAETTYRRFLVSPYIPLSDPPQTYTILWEPTPEPSGFIPAVYASDQVTCQR
jgi:hypothetical protein